MQTRRAAIAGACGAAIALATGELVTAVLSGAGPTPVTAVGTEFIDRFAASLKELAVAVFGTNDKTALIAGIVVTSLVLGAALGVAARRWWPIAPIGFVAFGCLGGWALASDPLGSPSTAVVSAVLAVLAGIAAFSVLWHVASGRASQRPRPNIAAAVPARRRWRGRRRRDLRCGDATPA